MLTIRVLFILFDIVEIDVVKVVFDIGLGSEIAALRVAEGTKREGFMVGIKEVTIHLEGT